MIHDIRFRFTRVVIVVNIFAVSLVIISSECSCAVFVTVQERDDFYRVLMELDLPNVEPADNLRAVQDLWLNGKMTNFDYLMHLNRHAGRSFNDLMQYPVFPFVLSQYDQHCLDLSNTDSYRFDTQLHQFSTRYHLL